MSAGSYVNPFLRKRLGFWPARLTFALEKLPSGRERSVRPARPRSAMPRASMRPTGEKVPGRKNITNYEFFFKEVPLGCQDILECLSWWTAHCGRRVWPAATPWPNQRSALSSTLVAFTAFLTDSSFLFALPEVAVAAIFFVSCGARGFRRISMGQGGPGLPVPGQPAARAFGSAVREGEEALPEPAIRLSSLCRFLKMT